MWIKNWFHLSRAILIRQKLVLLFRISFNLSSTVSFVYFWNDLKLQRLKDGAKRFRGPLWIWFVWIISGLGLDRWTWSRPSGWGWSFPDRGIRHGLASGGGRRSGKGAADVSPVSCSPQIERCWPRNYFNILEKIKVAFTLRQITRCKMVLKSKICWIQTAKSSA